MLKVPERARSSDEGDCTGDAGAVVAVPAATVAAGVETAATYIDAAAGIETAATSAAATFDPAISAL